ncbi:non-ribosomal peptide synthetase/type I polyketide synthase [Streptomyces sp. JJ36]|uniref:non-ribosomal peptide synthetase/type I polyketide synthase n=1 Tax=Streptomyces sp. JJ36 TaxID=2736645 RepID=UPI001F446B83|nr:non-ribosomal peptide synthetase/type I polyketide synthase [Streptomyces sp. JJ36]MCF6522530.1 amino acid adenylation domain-containing protein [Streptomyces sp. JJ36]
MTPQQSSAPQEPVDDAGDIAVIGLACRFPGAPDTSRFWHNLRTGVESVSFYEEAELLERGVPAELLADPWYVRAASVLEEPELFDAAFFGYNARDAAMIDPQQRILLETAHAALEDAGCVPAAFPGSIGVYAGSSLSTYLVSHLLSAGPGFADIADATELLTTNDKDYLATRISYGLDLDGPAVSVQTACSSSLVAVHMAVQALLGHECDVAVTGGASVRLPQGLGYLHRQGMIFSADGHTRSFDAAGSGTMFGSGVGAVVLKRLADALADGDRVDAVIKGSAVTNDGSAKVGYTAPGVDGQSRAIAGALGVAGIEPHTVTAIEGHGTATPLGDPIEVTALTRVYGRGPAPDGGCALSSVKSNVGHLAEAAGVAGLIKAVLQLRHRELVPSLHFEKPNPELGLERSPFRVVTGLEEWQTGGTPRRIGVSSFGMGGTNAHVVLEEGPAPEPSRPFTRDLFLLPLSARTPAALESATDALATALTGPAGDDLAATATTLQQGRTHHGHRRLVVAGGAADAREALRARDAGRVVTHRAAEDPRVVFMFPGQGSQYPGMGRRLYEQEPVFRRHFDECADELAPHLGLDLREVVHPAGDADPGEAAARLRRTDLAQPALFALGYALTELLGSVGVAPDAMVGHSVGEILAACRSGVLSLPDALRLAAVRGRLMQEMPPGGMLSVPLAEEDVRRRLPDGLSLAAVNAPELCVVSGPDAQVAAFADTLHADDVPTRRLHTSHAFHSAMVEPVLDAFGAALDGIDFRAPRLPYVTNRTGTWATAAQAQDPRHWVRHIREPVRFGDGVRLLTESGPAVLVEIGPGTTLCSLAREAARGRGAATVPLLPGPGEEQDDAHCFTEGLGRLWLAGAALDWELVQGGTARRTGLPTYPFERRRYWIEPASGETPARSGGYRLQVPEGTPAESDGMPQTDGACDPRPALTTEYVEPRDPREREIAAIWRELLGVAPVGVHDNFMELGGHSLLAARVVERVKAALGTEVRLADLLAEPTVAGVAALLADGAGEDAGTAGDQAPTHGDRLPAAVPDPGRLHDPFPLSEMQQAQWIGRQDSFQGGNIAAHVYWEVDVDAGVDLERLEAAWQRVVDRHDMLRAVIDRDGTQRILPEAGPYPFARLDLRQSTAEDAERRLTALRDALSHEVRPADRWPLFDVRVTLLPGDRTRLHFSFDLLIADIGSIRLLVRDWRRYYQEREDEIRPLRISYRDYVLASERIRDTALHTRSLEYWRDRVAELPPGPDLPLALNPGALTDPDFTARDAQLPADRWQSFRSRAAAAGVTPSAALLAAYAAALGTWSRTARFSLNVTVINRLQVHEDVRDLVGEFASFDLLPVDLSTGQSFGALATALQRQSWEDLEYRYLNGVEILREMARLRGGTSGSVMPVVFTSTLVQENEAEDASMFGWLGEMLHEIAQTPQVWLDFAVMENADGVQLSWHWLRRLFPEGVVDAVFDAFHALVDRLATSDEAWGSAAHCPLPPAQRELIEQANATGGPLPDGFLYSAFLARAEEHPDRVAVTADDGELTYGELRAHACALAHRLRGLGAGPGRLVAVALEKGRAQIVAALAVQLAGGAYLPVDPGLPAERQDHLCSRGEVRLVLARADGTGRHWPGDAREVPVDLAAAPEGPGADGVPPEPVQVPDDLAYVIFTSGSTGEPKGVMLSHRAALNTLEDINERFHVGPEDAVLGLSSLSFDLSVYDVFGVLGAGGLLVLPRPGTSRDPGHWDDLVRRHRVTLWNSVPALLRMYVEHLAGAPGGDGAGAGPDHPLRLALMSGDWIPVDLAARLREVAPHARPVSLGGATEAAVWSIWHPIDPDDTERESVPYGRPLRNQTFHVLNDRMEPCPVWGTGELYIGGAGLALGYWRDEERTRSSFVTWPATGERLYRTGDLGRRLPDGTLEFLGREDFQVKVGGFRIELGEIEAVLTRHADVRTALAAAPGDRHNRRLVAYLLPEADPDARTPESDARLVDEVTALAEAALPAYMVPTAVLVLDRLPLSANGKVDRSALPDPARTTAGADAAAGPVAARLVELVAEVVGVPGVGPHDNFFSVGGNSIMGVQIVSRANAEGLDFTAADLFQHETLGELAAVLEARGAVVAGTAQTVPATRRQARLLEAAAPGTPAGAHRAELLVTPGTGPEELETALAAVTARHTALHHRLAEAGGTGGLVRNADGADVPVPHIDLTSLPGDRRTRAFHGMVEEMHQELCPYRGPVTKAALFDLGDEGRRLVWLVHELLVDGASWQALLRDLGGAAQAVRDGADPSLPAADEQQVRALTALAAETSAYVSEPGPPPETEDGDDGGDLFGLTGAGAPHTLHTALTEEDTTDLLDAVDGTYRLSPARTAAAALALAARAAGHRQALRCEVEDEQHPAGEEDRRERLPAGSFSASLDALLPPGPAARGDRSEPPASGEDAEADVLLRAVKSLREGDRPSADGPAAPVLVRHLGALDLPPDGPLRLAGPPRLDAAGHPVVLDTHLESGRLHLTLACRADEAAVPHLTALRDALPGACRRIAAHCRATGTAVLTPGDFPLAGLDEDTLTAFLGAFADDGPGARGGADGENADTAENAETAADTGTPAGAARPTRHAEETR